MTTVCVKGLKHFRTDQRTLSDPPTYDKYSQYWPTFPVRYNIRPPDVKKLHEGGQAECIWAAGCRTISLQSDWHRS